MRGVVAHRAFVIVGGITEQIVHARLPYTRLDGLDDPRDAPMEFAWHPGRQGALSTAAEAVFMRMAQRGRHSGDLPTFGAPVALILTMDATLPRASPIV